MADVYRNIPEGYAADMGRKSGITPLARNISRLRVAKGLKQHELAALMDVKQGAVSKWENGGLMSPDALPLLAVTLGANLDDLLRGTNADYDAFAEGRRAGRLGKPGDPFVRALVSVVTTLKTTQQLTLLNVARSYAHEQQTALEDESTPETVESTTPTRSARPRRGGRGSK